MPKQYASLLFRFTLLFAVLISSFLIMDWAAYSIPNGAVADNVIKSEKRILEEGTYPNPTHVAFFQQDNYTDALMLSLCVTGDSTATPIQNAMTNPYLKNDSTPMSQIGIDAATGKTDMHQPDFYGRYWHGYLLPLKAFSTVGDIWAIRITNYVALTLLLALASYLVWRRRGSRMAWAFLATMLLLGYPGIPLCMQFASCFYILFISVITLLLFEKTFSSTGNLCLAFFAIGSLTSFFDLLTAPLLTLGFPLAVFLFNLCSRRQMRQTVTASMSWGAGYALTWMSKWILTSMLTGYDMVANAFGQAAFRSGGTIPATLDYGWVMKNISALIAFYAAATLLSIIFLTKSTHNVRLRKNSALRVMALMPLAWYLCLRNHSLIHFWFAWRSTGISLMCIVLYFWQLRNQKNHSQKSVYRT